MSVEEEKSLKATCNFQANEKFKLSYSFGDIFFLRTQKSLTYDQIRKSYRWILVTSEKQNYAGYVSTDNLVPVHESMSSCPSADVPSGYTKLQSILPTMPQVVTCPMSCPDEEMYVRLPSSHHNFVSSFVTTPIICLHCRDYIWGSGKQGVCCNMCLSYFHQSCKDFCQLYVCKQNTEVYPYVLPLPILTDTPVTSWTNTHILEWLAACNFFPLIELFKVNNIKGSDLPNYLDMERLIHIGIRNPGHRNSLQLALKDLLSAEILFPSRNVIAESTSKEELQAILNHTHNFLEVSFPQPEVCDFCNNYLRGINTQGLQCTVCQYIVHRTCMKNGITETCAQIKSSGRPLRKLSYTISNCLIYGSEIDEQFNVKNLPAPNCLVLATRFLERISETKKIDLSKLYKPVSIPDYFSFDVNEDFLNSDQVEKIIIDVSPEQIVCFVKKFLREIQNPLIPLKFYDQFIRASKMQDEQAIQCIKSYVNQLPPNYRSTLQFFIDHMRRIAWNDFHNGFTGPPIIAIQSLCHFVIRPPWHKITELVNNTSSHIKILELLFYHGDFCEPLPSFDVPPQLPPRKISRAINVTASTSRGVAAAVPELTHQQSQPTVSSQPDIDQPGISAEWYWGKISRDEVWELLLGQRDGSFLVRDAVSNCEKGEYTLSVMKDGTEKLIRIYRCNNKFSFIANHSDFDSVNDLIEHYKHNSLVQYSYVLDVKLEYPIPRTEDNDSLSRDKLIEEYCKVSNNLGEMDVRLGQKREEYDKTNSSLNKKRKIQNHFKRAISMLSDQKEMNKKMREMLTNENDLLKMDECWNVVKLKLDQLESQSKRLEQMLQSEKNQYQCLEREINDIKPLVLSLCKQKEKIHNRLLAEGLKEDDLKEVLNLGYEKWKNKINSDIPHYDESTWFRENCTRQEAEGLLKDMPSGTFLIRSREKEGNYALSIVCNKIINHCIICKTERGYGFAEPYIIYSTLKKLVLHYALNSLEAHNETLSTTLEFPYKYIQNEMKAEGLRGGPSTSSANP